MITTNTVLIGRIADVVAIIAVITLPVRLPEAWENRYFKRLSKSMFYGLMSFSLLVTFICIVLSFNSMAKTNVVATIGLALIFLVYAILREKTGKVQMQKSYELQ
jgi:APA family basic amino acid/polyamine antiporter